MASPVLSEEIKVRLLPDWKAQLEQQASREGLVLSDIARRAISEYIKRNRRRK